MRKNALIIILLLVFSINGFSQENWISSITGFDQTYSPADFITASNGDIYLNGVKYDNGVSGFINKLYKSTNQGASWTEVSTTGLTDLGNVHSLTISGTKMLLAGMHVNSANGAKIFVSSVNTVTNIIDKFESNTNIRCFPNPFNTEIKIDIPNESSNLRFLRIISSTGETIYFSKPNSENLISTDNIETGIYLLILEYENKIETIKLIKNN